MRALKLVESKECELPIEGRTNASFQSQSVNNVAVTSATLAFRDLLSVKYPELSRTDLLGNPFGGLASGQVLRDYDDVQPLILLEAVIGNQAAMIRSDHCVDSHLVLQSDFYFAGVALGAKDQISSLGAILNP